MPKARINTANLVGQEAGHGVRARGVLGVAPLVSPSPLPHAGVDAIEDRAHLVVGRLARRVDALEARVAAAAQEAADAHRRRVRVGEGLGERDVLEGDRGLGVAAVVAVVARRTLPPL